MKDHNSYPVKFNLFLENDNEKMRIIETFGQQGNQRFNK